MHTEMFLLILRRGYVLFFKSPKKCQSLHQSAVWISLILEHGTRPHQSNHWNDQQPSDCTTHHLKEVSQRTCRVLFLERNVTRFNDGKAAFFCTRQPDVLATLDTPCPPPKKPTLAHYSSKLHERISIIFGTKRQNTAIKIRPCDLPNFFETRCSMQRSWKWFQVYRL